MEQKLLWGNGPTYLERVDGEEDLKLRPGINVNAPPGNGKCHCCGRHLSELKPFGKAGDPLVGDFDGALLVKTFRRDFRINKELETIWEECCSNCHSEEESRERLLKKYSEEEAEFLIAHESMFTQVSAYWLCRDCIILDEDEFHEKLYSDYAENKKGLAQVEVAMIEQGWLDKEDLKKKGEDQWKMS